MEARDYVTADAILARDVPAVPLYELRQFTAIDSAWCGDVGPNNRSWLWLTDLRPCEPGETP